MKATKCVRSLLSACVCIAILLSGLPMQPAYAVSPDIVISQVYGGGGNTGAPYKNDFIELFNRGSSTVSLNGWSVQYTSATGTGNFGANSGLITDLTGGSIDPGEYYLVAEAAGTSCSGSPCGADLPTPDLTDGTPINMSGTGGKVALVMSAVSLGCNGSTTVCTTEQLALIKDLIGYGSANFYEGVAAPTTSNTLGDMRQNGGCSDNDINAADFTATTPAPRNSASPTFDCSGSLNPIGFGLANPSSAAPGDNTLLTVTAFPGANPTSTSVSVSVDLTAIGGASSQPLYDDGSHGDVTAGDNVFTFTATVGFSTPIGPKTLLATIADAEARSTNTTIALTVTSSVITPIAGARAGGDGWAGTIQGNVTVVPNTFGARSFAIQDATGGLYVYPAAGITPPQMELGDLVKVQGTVDVFNNLLEFVNITNIANLGDGVVPSALITDTGVVTDTQGLLIQIEGQALSVEPPYMTIDDGSGAVMVYVYGLTGISLGAFSAEMTVRVTGMSGAHHEAQVNPRYQTDVIDASLPTVISTVPTDAATAVSLYHPIKATFSKPMDASTIDTTSFTLTESLGDVSGAVNYDAGSKTASFTPDAILSPTTLYTASLSAEIEDTFGISLTLPYSWTFTTGAVDVTPLAIEERVPAPDAVNVSLGSSVVITFTEDIHPSTLDQDHFLLESPYSAVPYTLSYNPDNFVVTLDPVDSLVASTPYTVTVLGTIEDWAGLAMGSDSMWTFETIAEPSMQVFFGDLHNHTNISDGSGTPAEALAAGKTAGFDFMAISDHSYSINDTEWADTLAAVNAATTSSFLALRGFEYTQGAEGHINVYNTVRHAVRTDTTSTCTFCDYTPNLEAGATVDGFYEWAASTGLIGLDSAGTVMQFNHPGWINFNDWTYHPEVSSIAKLEEVGNGNGASYDFSEDQFLRSLDYGWKVGATNNADTHTASWGVNTDHRTGVIMTELTKDSLLEALQARRTFATEDKNFSLLMKANGAWMGFEIANTGSVLFDITGSDPDGEPATLVQIITDQGKVAMEFEPNTANFNLTPELDITTGVHYYYVKVTQVDGDFILSSPVWTMGVEDIAITDLVIQPTIPSIYSPSLLTVRVTNRNSSARSISVTLDVDGVPVGSLVDLSVPGNGDAFANFSWQPAVTGNVVVTAQISGAPVGDNPDDNASALHLTVTDEQVPLILIDAGHGNLNAVGNEMQMFFNDLSAHQYNVLKNLDELTAADLNPAVVKLLLITAPATDYSNAELTAISDYVKAGGSLWLCGMSDYSTGALVANRVNAILAAIETGNGAPINMRLNDDEILDGNDNNGYPWGVTWGSFPMTMTTGIGINVEAIASWSVASLVGHETNQPLTSSTPNVQIVVQGDLDIGYTGSYNDPNHTSNTDADSAGDAYIYNPGWVYPAYPDIVPAGAIPVPMGAVTDLPGAAGRILLYGDSNDAFTTYAYTAGDGKQNELFNLEAVLWLIGEPLQKSTIAEARAQSQPNQPNNLDKLVWIEGEITAAYGEFFNVLYVQDETGGITVHAPAGDINSTQFTRGTKVRVVGTVGIYNGDTEIEFFEAEMVQVIEPGTGEPLPLPMSTHEASLEENQGWLAVITGTVTAKLGNDTIIVNDNSGPVRVFLDGYNGDFYDIQVRDLVQVTGLVSEDGDGTRIRVRNHGMHPEYADDVIKPTTHVYFPMVNKH